MRPSGTLRVGPKDGFTSPDIERATDYALPETEHINIRAAAAGAGGAAP